MGGESAGPGDVAMAGGVVEVAAFAESPFAAVVGFAEGEVISGDVLFAFGKAFFGNRELIHKGKTEVVLFRAEVDLKKAAGMVLGGFPTDLASEPGLITGGLEVAEMVEEVKKGGFEKVPVFGATGEEGTQPEFVGFGFVNVDDGEVALAGGGDVETQAELT